MKRLTIRADEVRVGDRLAEGGEPSETVTDTVIGRHAVAVGGALAGVTIRGVEIWTDADPMGMPALTLPADDQVEVWR